MTSIILFSIAHTKPEKRYFEYQLPVYKTYLTSDLTIYAEK